MLNLMKEGYLITTETRFFIIEKFKLFKSSDLDITFSVTNMYNRENIFYFNRVKYERINQLPLMPSLGASLIF